MLSAIKLESSMCRLCFLVMSMGECAVDATLTEIISDNVAGRVGSQTFVYTCLMWSSDVCEKMITNLNSLLGRR